MLKNANLQILGYGTFYDVPRGAFVKVDESIVYLHCDFDDVRDDYKDYYDVFLLMHAVVGDFYTGSFYHRKYDQIYVGQLLLSDVIFDPTRRKSLKSAKLEALVNRLQSASHKP